MRRSSQLIDERTVRVGRARHAGGRGPFLHYTNLTYSLACLYVQYLALYDRGFNGLEPLRGSAAYCHSYPRPVGGWPTLLPLCKTCFAVVFVIISAAGHQTSSASRRVQGTLRRGRDERLHFRKDLGRCRLQLSSQSPIMPGLFLSAIPATPNANAKLLSTLSAVLSTRSSPAAI